MMLSDQAVDDRAMRPQRRKRRFLILTDQPAVTDHIGGQDSSHPALKAIRGHARPRGEIPVDPTA
jgi:hypothetical protein